MNDKAVNVLEQYDMTVNRTFKGRGTIICDTDQGMRVLKEYRGRTVCVCVCGCVCVCVCVCACV